MEKHLMDLQMEKKLVVKEKDGERIVYPGAVLLYGAEYGPGCSMI